MECDVCAWCGRGGDIPEPHRNPGAFVKRDVTCTAESILSAILPDVQAVTPGAVSYDPRQCLGIYYSPQGGDDGADEAAMEFPALLIGQSAIAPLGVPCTMLSGFPGRPPGGCIIIGTWDELASVYPDAFEGLDKPDAPEGYLLRIDHHVLLAGVAREGSLMGAQTLIQILALAGEGAVPPMHILDYPSIPFRGCVYDLRNEVPELERLMRMTGFLAGFKGNRLHLVLDPLHPVDTTAGRGCLAEADLDEFTSVCREYGISLILWSDILTPMVDGEIGLEGALDTLLRLVGDVDVDGLGLRGRVPPAGRIPVQTLLDAVLEELDPSCLLFLEADTFADLFAETPGSVPARVACLASWNGIGSGTGDGDDDSGNGVAAHVELAMQAGAPLALHVPQLARGYVTATPETAETGLDACMDHAYGSAVEEVGFGSNHSGKGHSWESELHVLIGCVALGWCHRIGAAEAVSRFGRLAYGQLADRVRNLSRMVAEVYPDVMRGTESESLRRIAFGYPAGVEDWQRLRELDWHRIDSRIRESLRLLDECCQDTPRNAQNLFRIGVGLRALQMIGLQVIAYGQAVFCYEAACGGDRAQLEKASRVLDSLAESVPSFVQILTRAAENGTPCTEELAQLARFRTELAAASACLLRYAHTDEELPSMQELGIPDFGPAPEPFAEEDTVAAEPIGEDEP